MAGTTVSQFVQTQGTQLEVSTTATEDLGAAGLSYADLAITIKDPNFQGGQTTEIDVTVLKSTAKEYALGLDDSGTFSMAGNWKAGDPAQKALVAARSDKKTRAFRVTFADGAKFEFLGLVTQYQWQGQLDNVVSATFNVRVTGAVKMLSLIHIWKPRGARRAPRPCPTSRWAQRSAKPSRSPASGC